MEEATAPSTISDQDVYRLWWNFLKLSDKYAEYCQWREDKLSDPDLELPEKLGFLKDETKAPPFPFVYDLFQNPRAAEQGGRTYNFNVWWKRNQVFLSRIAETEHQDPVRNFGQNIRKEMTSVAARLSRQSSKKFTLNTFIDEFARHLTETMPPRLYVEIDMTADEMGPLLKQINEWLADARESPKLQFWKRFTDRTNWPASRKGLALLKRYLFVYDLHQKGMKMEQIVMKVGTATQRSQYSDASIKGVFEEDLAKARAIINNVEQGTFPGYYGKYTRF